MHGTNHEVVEVAEAVVLTEQEHEEIHIIGCGEGVGSLEDIQG
jgi:hypothetical protein